jgi:hypothetical protein
VSDAAVNREIAIVVAALGIAGCDRALDVERARPRARALVPPPYGGITRCEAPQPAAPDPGAVGFVPDPASPRIEGSLDRDLIARPIRARAPGFRACYLDLLAIDPDAAGRVLARFQVLADGSVTAVEIEGWNAQLDACICDQVLRLDYPAFGSARFGAVVVHYPFVFAQ